MDASEQGKVKTLPQERKADDGTDRTEGKAQGPAAAGVATRP